MSVTVESAGAVAVVVTDDVFKVTLIDVITDGTIAVVTGWTFTVVGFVSVDASGN